MPTIAPKALSGRVREFCRTVNADSEPVFVPVVPAEDALARECFPNVARLVEERGGALVYGWAVWMWPNVYIEAEHHAVWRAPGGALLDPTLTPHGEDRILSVPDPAADYDFAGNRLRDNIRWPLTSDPAVADFRGGVVGAGRAPHGGRRAAGEPAGGRSPLDPPPQAARAGEAARQAPTDPPASVRASRHPRLAPARGRCRTSVPPRCTASTQPTKCRSGCAGAARSVAPFGASRAADAAPEPATAPRSNHLTRLHRANYWLPRHGRPNHARPR
jgi:hypothetical protein